MDLKEELAIAIAETRGGKSAGEFAAFLIKLDAEHPKLVGITHIGKAVTWHSATWHISEFDLEERGNPLEREDLGRMRELSDVESWVREHGDRLYWIHPRFRWIL